MFRKPNKTTINKIKTTYFYRSTSLFVLRWRPWYYAPRPSPEYSSGKRSGDGLGAMHLGLHLNTHAEKEIRYIQYRLLMFRKPNKTTINKIKTTYFYRSTSFRFSFISRYFNIFQVKRIVIPYNFSTTLLLYKLDTLLLKQKNLHVLDISFSAFVLRW
jgi:hypothetical protein